MSDLSVTASIVSLAAAGDEHACALLVAEHHRAMLGAAFIITGDTDGAREAVQAAWAIAWRRLGAIRDPGRIRPWLVAIAANEARHQVRGRSRRSVIELRGSPARAPSDPADAIDVLDLRRALGRLSPDDRSLVALRYGAGLDSSQIAQHSGLSASGVRSRLARVLERLRRDLDDE